MLNFVMMPGSYNPLHESHLDIAHHIYKNFGCEPIFEICLSAHDKASVSEEDVKKRTNQFELLNRRYITSYNTSFVQKVANIGTLFSEAYGCTNRYFAVGFDTIARVDDRKYYFGSEQEKIRCLDFIKRKKWRFIVFPRNGKLDDGLSDQIKEICSFQRDFVGKDISSSDIRNNINANVCLKHVPIDNFVQIADNIYQVKANRISSGTLVYNGEEYFLKDPNTPVKICTGWFDIRK